MKLNGAIFAGNAEAHATATFHAVDPATGDRLEPAFSEATREHVALACAAAQAASVTFAELDGERRAQLLDRIADTIAALGDALLERAVAESGLPRGRIENERGRTIGQLRLFAELLRDDGWMGIRIDPGNPDRQPAPAPRLIMRKIALGPVAVFGASNFPLAFSVAGGDTASALAAGCPVVVKGHPCHPGTGELVARAVREAVAACGLLSGVFSYLPGTTHELGAALVADPRIMAVGFTGSRAGGLALVETAQRRPVPIPVYAEMSSINPVILLPGRLKLDTDGLAAGYVASATLGAGQFCTNPGLVLAIGGPDLDRFLSRAASLFAAAPSATMLSPQISTNFDAARSRMAGKNAVATLAAGQSVPGAASGQAFLLKVDGRDFLADAGLMDEAFGPSSLVVQCRDFDQLHEVLRTLEGQLTATLHCDAADEPMARALIPTLERMAGRILANGWPTGVEVSPAMVHGGPFPATSDSRATSVGTLAIERFLRPVCYQNLPDALLPAALRAG